MLIYLIYGPTCSGKTDLAIQIARETGWPVIALDRVQCCPQIAAGSGRSLEFASEHNIAISELLDLDPMRRQALIEAIADEYLEHARWQERDFPDWQEGGNVRLTPRMGVWRS
ncbi:hypothetical protein I6F11_28430 [Ensifer sp. NBAIM29]|nr:hypothetical protein [Ensifer sp. NBAIM29]